MDEVLIVVGIKNGELELRGHKPSIEDTYGPSDEDSLVAILVYLGLDGVASLRMSGDMDHAEELKFKGAVSFFQKALEKAVSKLTGKVSMRKRFQKMRSPPSTKKTMPRKKIAPSKKMPRAKKAVRPTRVAPMGRGRRYERAPDDEDE